MYILKVGLSFFLVTCSIANIVNPMYEIAQDRLPLRDALWNITDNHANKFEKFISRGSQINFFQERQRYIGKKEEVRIRLMQQRVNFMNLLQEKSKLSPTQWHNILVCSRMVHQDEIDKCHLAASGNSMTMSLDMERLFIKQLEKRKRHPSRINLSATDCDFYTIQPTCKVFGFNNSSLFMNMAQLRLGEVSFNTDLMKYFPEHVKKAFVLFATQVFTDNNLILLKVIDSFIQHHHISCDFVENDYIYLGFIYRKAMIELALKSHKKACAMQQWEFVQRCMSNMPAVTEDFLLLSKIERYWKTLIWLEKNAENYVSLHNVSTSDRYRLLDFNSEREYEHVIQELQRQNKEQQKEYIEQRLQKCRELLIFRKGMVFTLLKDKFKINDIIWSNLTEFCDQLGEIEKNNRHINLPHITHELPSELLDLLIEYLQALGINPQRINIGFSSDDQIRISPAGPAYRSIYHSDQDWILSANNFNSGEIFVPPYITKEWLLIVAHTFAHAIRLEPLLAHKEEYNITPYRFETSAEWKQCERLIFVLPFISVATTNYENACFVQKYMLANTSQFSLIDCAFVTEIKMLLRIYNELNL